MTTTTTSSTKTINVAGVGPVDLTVEKRGDGRPYLVLHGARVRSQSPSSRSCSPRKTTTGYSRPRIPDSEAQHGQRRWTAWPSSPTSMAD